MIICCGEALIDFIPTEDGQAYPPCPGGSILNIAVGLGRMGIPVGFLSRLSTDLFGDMLADHLIGNQVDLKFCPQCKASCRDQLSFGKGIRTYPSRGQETMGDRMTKSSSISSRS